MVTAAQKRLLIVEDTAKLAKLLQAWLKLQGFAVHTASDGAAALRYAGERRPDLVILDLRLPDMDGLEVCRKLRILYQPWGVPIIMLTGMDRPIDQLRGFAHGADAYLTKPCDPQELLRTAQLLLEGQPATCADRS